MNVYTGKNRSRCTMLCQWATRNAAVLANFLVVLVVCVVVLGLAGCGKGDTASSTQQTPAEAAADPFNLTGLRNAFAKASPGLQVIIDEAIGSVRAGDRASALRQFEALLQRKDITKEQKAALEEVVAKLRGTPSTVAPQRR